MRPPPDFPSLPYPFRADGGLKAEAQHNAVVSHIAKPLRLELEVLKLSSIGVPEPPHPLVTLIEALGALD